MIAAATNGENMTATVMDFGEKTQLSRPVTMSVVTHQDTALESCESQYLNIVLNESGVIARSHFNVEPNRSKIGSQFRVNITVKK